jgi:hypothetical protein
MRKATPMLAHFPDPIRSLHLWLYSDRAFKGLMQKAGLDLVHVEYFGLARDISIITLREIATDSVPAVSGLYHLLGHVDQRGMLGIPNGGNPLGAKMQKSLEVGFDLNRDRALIVDLADL